jgi:hypothetical protein
MQRLHAVASHAAVYLQRWCEKCWNDDADDPDRARMQAFALLLVAAGRGPARLPTCEHTLRHARFKMPVRGLKCTFQPVVSAIFVRALSFFGPGELRALRVEDAGFFGLVVSTLRAPETATQAAQALDSLCAVEVVAPSYDAADSSRAAPIIESCAATLTELKGYLPGRVLCASDGSGRPPVLACCTRLEILIFAYLYTPAVWLGLSQLHTLRGVDLGQVSTAAIAAALPRLHTLTMYSNDELVSVDSVAGFFTDLLPRLRLFHFFGMWPREAATAAAAPLPQLEELEWYDSPDGPTRQLSRSS